MHARLQDALKEAEAQAQVRPVEERIASSKVFIERAKKRIIAGREEVSRAQEVLTTAQANLLTEERGLPRHVWPLCLSRSLTVWQPSAPADFAQELAELRHCVQQLQRENACLRSQLQVEGRGEERERKHPRNLSTPSLDLVPFPQPQTVRWTWGRVFTTCKECPNLRAAWNTESGEVPQRRSEG